MKKKAYISPETEVTIIKIGHLMLKVSGGDTGIQSEEEPDEEEGTNVSRRHRNVWDEEEEDW